MIGMTETRPCRVYLDTNAFIQMVQDPGSDSAILLDRISGGWPWQKHLIVTSELTLAELLVDPLERGAVTGDYGLADIYVNLMSEEPGVRHVEPISRSVLVQSAKLRGALGHKLGIKVKLPDAIHLATALATGCKVIVSNDKGFLKAARSLPLIPASDGYASMSAVSLAVDELRTLATELGCP